MPKIVEQKIETIIDQDGSILEKKHNMTKRYEDEPEYIKMYLDTVLYLKDLPKGYNSILLAFLKRMTYSSNSNNGGGQMIYVNAHMKNEIASELSVSLARVNQAITDFVKGKIFFRAGRGTYQVNAHLFGKGDWQNIKEIRMKIHFDPNGKSIMSEIEKNIDSRKSEDKQETILKVINS